MKVFRILTLAYSLMLLFLGGIGALGWGIDGCDSACARIRDWPASGLITILGIVAIAAMAIAVIKEDARWFAFLSIASAATGLGLLPVMESLGGHCNLCLSVDFALVALAVSNLPKAGSALACLPALAAVAYPAIQIYDPLGSPPKPQKYALRRYEPPLARGQTAYVLFADPECGACRKLKKRLEAELGPHERLLVRWHLVAKSEGRSLRAAIVYETISRQNLDEGRKFLSALYDRSAVVSDETVLDAAADAGYVDLARRSLSRPDPEVLEDIALDGSLAERLRIREVPALYEAPSVVDGVPSEQLFPISLDVYLKRKSDP